MVARGLVFGLAALLLLCTGLVMPESVRAAPESQVIETKHYRLHYEGRRSAAAEAGRVLEAAWTGFEAWFGAAPKLAKEERLTVRFYADGKGWAAGIRADGTRPPLGAGGYYWPGTKTAYLFRQPTAYFTRTLLIHEAAHQFHFLTRTRNRSPSAGWYTEGLAEFLSWHRWDGKALTLGVLPGVSLKDYAAKALVEVQAKAFDLGAIVSGGAPASRPVGWALFRFLATGADGKPVPRFDDFRAKMDRGGKARPLFQKYFGRPDRLQPKFRAWLEAHQTPWAPVFNEWEQIGPAQFRGYAGVVTACRLKVAVKRLRARLEAPTARRWRAGLLLHWTSNDDYTVALLTSGGSIRVDRRRGGRWEVLARDRLVLAPEPDAIGFEARREGARVHLRIAGQDVGAWRLPGHSLGLCLERGDLRFAEVRPD